MQQSPHPGNISPSVFCSLLCIPIPPFCRSSNSYLCPEKPYNLSFRLQGQRVTLEVNTVRVLTYDLVTHPSQGQLGLFAWGEGRVEFKAARFSEELGKVFVVMPLLYYYLNQFYKIITPIINNKYNNLATNHADETFGLGLIIKDIENDIIESKIVIGEITELNPNVYYEACLSG